jgi:hypothetical protein
MRSLQCEVRSAKRIALKSFYLGHSKEDITKTLIEVFGDFYLVKDSKVYRHYNSNVENLILILE